MRFHAPSFLLGVGVTAGFMATRERLRPVAGELGALGLHLARLGRSLAERQREELEDLFAEIEERVRARARQDQRRHAPFGGAGSVSSVNGAVSSRA